MAVVRFHDRVADRQSQAGALTRFLGRKERREQLCRDRVGDSRSRVGHAQVHLAVEPRAHGDASRQAGGISGDGVRRVRQQVEHHLLQRVTVAEDVGEH